VHAVANDYDAIEGEAGLGAVPGDELIDGVLDDGLPCRRIGTTAQTVWAMQVCLSEECGLAGF